MIDDEKPALKHLEMLLLADGRFSIEGTYMSGRAGLEHLASRRADVVFLDIGMPEMNGLDVGEYIQQMDSDIRIVYVTAYSEYAIEAFEHDALDYVLKPVIPDRFAKTLDRIVRYVPSRPNKPAEPVWVRCFGRLSFETAGNDRQLKWKTAKAQELFAYLLSLQERWVAKESILHAMWPDYPTDKALTYLHTTVSQIRKLLREWEIPIAVEYALDSYRLVLSGVRYDVAEFEQTAAQETGITEAGLKDVEETMALYRGDYLEEYDYGWAEIARTRLLERYMEFVAKVAACELECGRERKALERLHAAQHKAPYSEELFLLLLSGYAALSDLSSLHRCYEAYKEVLLADLGIEPGPRAKSAYERYTAVKSPNLT